MMSHGISRLAGILVLLIAGVFQVALSQVAIAASGKHLMVSEIQLRATAPGMTATGGYTTIMNASNADDRLIAVSAKFSGKSEVHTMLHENGVMKMRRIEGGLVIPAGKTVILQPGGIHLMFMGIDTKLTAGDSHRIMLEFASGAMLHIDAVVKRPADIKIDPDPTMGHDH